MKRFVGFLEECRRYVPEVFPEDLAERLEKGEHPLLLDVREPDDYFTSWVSKEQL